MITKEAILLDYKAGKLSTDELKKQIQALKNQIRTDGKLSEGQKGLWMLQKADPQNSAYNIPISFRLNRQINTELFTKAAHLVLKQHPILSMSIEERGGEPFQVYNRTALELYTGNISHLKNDEVLPFLKEKVKIPFVLDSSPLMRIYLLSKSQSEHIVLIVLHHIVFDGSSFVPLVTTLLDTYLKLSKGQPHMLSTHAASYFDFVDWEENMIATEEGQGLLKYWEQQLSTPLPTLLLPTDHSRAAAKNHEGKTHTVSLSPQVASRMKEFSKNQRINLPVIFLAVFKTLLHRYSDQEDIIVGMPTRGRPKDCFESMVGYFINMVPIRSRIEASTPFNKFVKELQYTVVDGIDNSAYPFPAIIRDLEIPVELGTSPVFQSTFTYQNFLQPNGFRSFQDRYGETLSLEFITDLHQEGEYEFCLEVFELESDFSLHLKYNPELYSTATIQKMMDHYTRILEGAIEHPDTALDKFSLISDADERALKNWNDTAVHYPNNEKCIHSIIEEQARKTPNGISVEFEEESMTYAELNTKANQVAHQLSSMGVVTGDIVGICMERSCEMIIAMLGIMKAGGAYAPVDPEYPSDRIQYILEDAGVSVVLTQEQMKSHVPEYSGTTLCLDSQWDKVSRQAQSNPNNTVNNRNLAYVLYTSGSTGKPKGCLLPHHPVVNRLLWMNATYKLGPGDRVLQKTPYSFDVSVTELFCPLFEGATLVFAKPGGHKEPRYLIETIENSNITTCHFVPSMLTSFLLELQEGDCTDLKRIYTSGEALPYPLVEKVDKQLNATLHNLYGPTEAAVDVTFWDARLRADRKVPIGKPIGNVELYVLDSNLDKVAIGMKGELCIGGMALALGYMNRPDLTDEVFVGNPFNSEAESRLYRTGDLVAWMQDGNIEYFGRIDNQVKVRGFRIELGEVESVLAKQPAIRDQVVVPYTEQDGSQHLAAYVVFTPGQEMMVKQLRNALKKDLPDFMVPSIFMQLDKMPIGLSGKADRKSLPQPKNNLETGVEYIAANDETSMRLVEIWKKSLDMEKIGITDDFFDLGGQSLKAIALLYDVSKAFDDISISLTDFYEEPTIVGLAKKIAEGGSVQDGQLVQLLKSESTTDYTLVCFPYAGASATIYSPLAAQLKKRKGISLFAASIPGNEVGTDPDGVETVENIAEICAAEILEKIDGEIVMYGHCGMGSALAAETTRLLEHSGRKIKFAVFGAILPLKRYYKLASVRDPYGSQSDVEINELQQAWGAEEAIIPKELRTSMIRKFRANSTEYFRWAKLRGSWKLDAPVFNIVADDDPVTQGYRRRFTEWKMLSNSVQLYRMETGQHYFINEKAPEVADMLCEMEQHLPVFKKTKSMVIDWD